MRTRNFTLKLASNRFVKSLPCSNSSSSIFADDNSICVRINFARIYCTMPKRRLSRPASSPLSAKTILGPTQLQYYCISNVWNYVVFVIISLYKSCTIHHGTNTGLRGTYSTICMYLCTVTHLARVRTNRVTLPILLVIS